MSETAYNIWGDVDLITAAVYEAVRQVEWSSTGGTDGCAQCSPVEGESLSFRARVERGHLICAEELARDRGAKGIREHLVRGVLDARVRDALSDPRFGLREAKP